MELGTFGGGNSYMNMSTIIFIVLFTVYITSYV